jgi:hypothetical protein
VEPKVSRRGSTADGAVSGTDLRGTVVDKSAMEVGAAEVSWFGLISGLKSPRPQPLIL